MPVQRSVQQQNALQKCSILSLARQFRSAEPRLQWIAAVLQQYGFDPEHGILACAGAVPCGGNHQSAQAIWVSASRRFVSIEATIAFDDDALVSVEAVEDITDSTVVSMHERGTGRTFGWLALEVLEELGAGV
jgi:hypothetical protein